MRKYIPIKYTWDKNIKIIQIMNPQSKEAGLLNLKLKKLKHFFFKIFILENFRKASQCSIII